MRLYLAHPFNTRKVMREWELGAEVKYDIEIVNPFYDITRDDIVPIDNSTAGRYELLDCTKIVNRDIDAIAGCEGVVAIVSGDTSYGTIMEIVYASMFDLPVYIVWTNGHEQHPWLKYHAKRIFTCLKDLEDEIF